MKTYTLRRVDRPEVYYQKAHTPAEAMSKMMDKRYSSWWGPMYIDGLWEIYQQDGMKLKFTVN